MTLMRMWVHEHSSFIVWGGLYLSVRQRATSNFYPYNLYK